MDVVHFSWHIRALLLYPVLLQIVIELDAAQPASKEGRTNINSEIVAKEGVIKSPRFPDPYPQDMKHLFRIQAENKRIQIDFTTFDIGTISKKRCVDDRLRVIYADDTERQLCGQSNFSLTAYEMLTLELVPAAIRLSGKRYRGFKANYEFTKIDKCKTLYVKQRVKLSGTFTSPFYPMPGYPPGLHCHYHIIGSQGYTIVLVFKDFDLFGERKNNNCYRDYLDLFNINKYVKTHALMKRYCGTFKNHRVAVNSSHLHLIFSTVTNRHHRGFLMHYSFVRNEIERPETSKKPKLPPNQKNDSSTRGNNNSQSNVFPAEKNNNNNNGNSDNISSVCGRTHHQGFSGQLEFQPSSFSHFNECLWRIQVPAGWQVLLIFVQFRIGVDGLCNDRHLLIYDGKPQDNTKPMAKLCGHRGKMKKEFMSSGTEISIKLVSRMDKPIANQMFQINWSAFLESARANPCHGFTCAGGKVCIDPAGLSCRQLPQRCLHESVKCDGIHNCGTEDDSDESGCISDAVRYSVLGATCFLFVLFLVSTVVILKSRASEHACSCASSSSAASANASRDDRSHAHRINGSINRDLMEMTSLNTKRLPTSSGLASSRHRYSYEVIVNQEALRASDEPVM